MTSHLGTHSDLHSEQGAVRGEHPGRAKNPVIKVLDLAWLEYVKPDLAASERFAHAFGFTTVSRTADELQLRGTDAGTPCVIVRRGPRSRYLGAAFRAADSSRRGAARRCHRGEGREAAGEHRRPHRGPDRPERGAGAGCRRHPRARRICRASRRRCSTSVTMLSGRTARSVRRASRRRSSAWVMSCCRPRRTSRP